VSDGWSFGGSILTFAFPMLLFIVVAATLYVQYTKPASVPGRRSSTVERPVSHTPIPGTPITTQADAGVAGGGKQADAGVAGEVEQADAVDAKAADGKSPAPEVQE
jgi:hypothetical protein